MQSAPAKCHEIDFVYIAKYHECNWLMTKPAFICCSAQFDQCLFNSTNTVEIEYLPTASGIIESRLASTQLECMLTFKYL